MGRDIFDISQAARDVYGAADEALGFSIARLCFEGPEEELRRTEIQQPALLTTSIALLRALEEVLPIAPSYLAGHSLGEYSALVAADAISLEDGVQIVHARGRFMQEAVGAGMGAMAAILGCAAEVVAEVCRAVALETGKVVAPANFNSPAQTVIAGEVAAVEEACERAKQKGAKRAVELPVSAPFHCELMAPAARKLRSELDRITFSPPSVPIVTNVEAAPNQDAAKIPDLLERQVTLPVRFTEMMKFLAGRGVTQYLEIGSGRVLVGLLARIQRRSERANLSSAADLEAAQEFLLAEG
jgi:[acyl-carrier-protein] S-malonyltransferase